VKNGRAAGGGPRVVGSGGVALQKEGDPVKEKTAFINRKKTREGRKHKKLGPRKRNKELP